MKLLVNISPIVLGAAMYADPGRTLNTVVIQRLEMVENLLGEPNTTSDLADPAARAAGSQGQPAMTDTDQLVSISVQQIEGALMGAVAGKILSGASSLQLCGAVSEACPGGICLSEFPTVFADKVAPGPFAHPNGWIPLRGPGRSFRIGEYVANNVNGARYGCHSCGTYYPGLARRQFFK